MTEMDMPQEQTDRLPSLEEMRQFTIIGSGVIGLLTAHELADQGHQVTIISNEGNPNKVSDSTSKIAIGQFLPWLPDAHNNALKGDLETGLAEVVDHSRNFYAALAENPSETGVMQIGNVELFSDSIPWPVGLPEAMDTEERILESPIELTGPDGQVGTFDKEYTFLTFSIDTRKTIEYLANRASEKGIRFVAAHVAPEQLTEMEGIIINATGMGAKELTGAEDIEHFKGHTILIKPAEGRPTPMEAISVDDLIIMPREDGTVIAGALYRGNPIRPIPEEEEADELLRRLTELAQKAGSLVEGLEPELFTEGAILLHSAGYRVVIKSGGIRVEPDKQMENVLHAYGFSGIGWSVGPAFAKKIAAQAVDMHTSMKGA